MARANFRLSLRRSSADHTAAAKVSRGGAKRVATGGTGLPAFLSGGRKKEKKISFWTPAKSGRASRLQGRGTRSCGHRSGPPSGPSASAAACRHMHASTAEAQPPRGTAGSGNPDHVLAVRVRTDGNGVALVPVLLRVARRVWWATDALICEAPRWLDDCVRQLNE